MPRDFNDIIHEERSKLLATLPKGAQAVCSAGCAGGWYFDWFEKHYGPVKVHYGVELYLEKPADLPDNVIWIQNSVADMKDVPSQAVDLLFSGQNIEHLYYQDIVGFFRESSRVVRDGGYLCIDSPNRLITQELGYLQPQHVLEFTAEDVARLVEAAGFEVVTIQGAWSCVRDGRRYGDVTTLTDDFEERCARATDRPDESFIWWLVARKTRPDTRPDLQATIEQVVTSKFAPFVAARFRKGMGTIESIQGTHATVAVQTKDSGCVFFGPYVPLTAGTYVAEFMVKFSREDGFLSVSVTTDLGRTILASREIRPSQLEEWRSETLQFTISEYTEGVETPLLSHGADALIRFGSQILRR